MIVFYSGIAYTVCHNVLRSSNFTRTWPISFHATADEYYCVADSCLVFFFHPLYPLRVETDGDVIFYGKEGTVYGNVRLEFVMSQSPCVDLRCVRTRTKM